ncbi:MAG: DUF1987 domain-containing protein [Bacteroidales bacterium]|nr:DUF1987 domain-containing protein [Bacteroidales bacterium]
MEKLYIAPSDFNPEIILSPHDNIFRIKGNSRPENVREIYDPVVQWLSDYKNMLISEVSSYSEDNPLSLQLDLIYFNSSTAKFLYDIVMIMKSIDEEGIPVAINWFHDPEDPDSLEAGEDLAILAEIDFKYIERQA